MAQAATLAGLVLYAVVLIHAALQDATTLKIRNQVVGTLLGGFLVLAPLAGFALAEIAVHAAVAGGVLLATFALFSFGWIGGGDAKLAAAIALWLGLDQTLAFVVYSTLIGGGLALLLLAFRAVPLPQLAHERAWVARLHSPRAGLPYALAMAPAGLLAFPSTPWFSLLAA
jgi:prepilin peptidase CpaA